MSKRIYVYIEADAAIDGASRFYWVNVGTSMQAMRDYLFLVAHAVNRGHFFELHSLTVAGFLMNVASSLGYSSMAELPFTRIDARDFVRVIKCNEAIPLNSHALAASEQQRKLLNPDYFLMSNLRKRQTSACGKTSKT